jgi:predicted Zn-dependent protease
MNNGYMNRDTYSTDNKHKTTMHELGHALSLLHQYDPTVSMMKQGELTYTDPTSLDISNLQWKY